MADEQMPPSAEELRERTQFFHNPVFIGPRRLMFLLPVAAYVASAFLVWWVHQHPDASVGLKISSTVVIGLWIVGPPVWFFLEYVGMAAVSPGNLPNIDAFKYTREMARNFWLAALAILLALATGHFPGGGGE